ncbi:MAG TPA: hypothetical protein VL068_02015 [Microthrixaceae bacterium]|nr:hypothetical protein [Microthrixaceae bacterium]
MVSTVAVIGVSALMTTTTVACSNSRDTQQIAATANPKNTVAPNTSIVVGEVPSTTTIPALDLSAASSPTDTQDTLTALLSQFAIDPSLLNQIAALNNGAPDLASIAGLLNIDLSALEGLGLSVEQLQSLGQTAAVSPDLIKDQLFQGGAGAALDPAMLIGLLTSSLDMNSLAQGAIGALISALTQALGEIRIEVTPQLTFQLGEFFDALDPEGMGQISVDPSNASLLAIITSAIISANPLLTEQLLSNPLLDPALKDLLVDLGSLSASLSDAATAALAAALSQLFPGLFPPGAIPGT